MTMPAWSYSSLTAYETCPRRYYLTRVAKAVAEPQTEATRWGNSVHKALELRVRDKTPLPEGMQQWEPLAAKFDSVQGRVTAETKYCLNAKLKPTTWFAKDAWCRGILDLTVNKGVKLAVLDWKTGKPKPDSDQLKLFAAFIFQTIPAATEVSTGFIWLKDGKITKETYTRDQLPDIWQEFMPRVRRLEIAYEDEKWEAKPSGLCREWCPVGKAHCLHCGK